MSSVRNYNTNLALHTKLGSSKLLRLHLPVPSSEDVRPKIYDYHVASEIDYIDMPGTSSRPSRALYVCSKTEVVSQHNPNYIQNDCVLA